MEEPENDSSTENPSVALLYIKATYVQIIDKRLKKIWFNQLLLKGYMTPLHQQASSCRK